MYWTVGRKLRADGVNYVQWGKIDTSHSNLFIQKGDRRWWKTHLFGHDETLVVDSEGLYDPTPLPFQLHPISLPALYNSEVWEELHGFRFFFHYDLLRTAAAALVIVLTVGKTGLFAATVAAFIIEVYKQLLPDSGDATVDLLAGISTQIAFLSNGTRLPSTSPQSFHAPAYTVRINTLWFISLGLSLFVALAATLMQQWSRRYLRAARRRGPPHKRGPVHIHLHDGMKRFRIEDAVDIIIGLLHLSVFLFIAGLVDFLFVISPAVARAFSPSWDAVHAFT
ncbi:hypothetical protein OF83DRAFT_1285699 [Amylostereum chailletii]|nr:hypothetical protein OF83DRAFT_1285699 [Amylostereum chailletii]